MPETLVFIDTNIFLDFYRVRSREAGLSILKHIDENHDRLIMTSQIEMEFQKNRQNVILESHRGIKPSEGGPAIPSVVAESKQSKALKRTQKGMQDLSNKLRKRLANVLTKPSAYDPVYRTVHKLAQSDSPTNLGRNNKLRYEIRKLAWKRFILGYPPRKEADTSIGDAINWEWIVRCAQVTKANVVIVSRDSDYGSIFDGKPTLNDWLTQEFKSRVSSRRTVSLSERLSEGLKAASVSVTKAEEQGEKDLLALREELMALRETTRKLFAESLGGFSGDIPSRAFLHDLWSGFTKPPRTGEPLPKGLLYIDDESSNPQEKP